MPRHHDSAFTRREFLSQGVLLASASVAVPAFIQSSAQAMTRAFAGLANPPGIPEDHILVVVQLSGGNDGLNTVVPFSMPEYYKARSSIAIPEKEVLRFTGTSEGVGLHPALKGLMDLHDQGQLSVVQGVGYPNPNRSHFKSMDIWQTADTSATGDGWIGRYFDAECCGYGKGESGHADAKGTNQTGGPPGIAIGRTAPLAMEGRQVKPVAFDSAELFRWSGQDIHKSLVKPYDDLNRRGSSDEVRPGSNADFLLRTALDAQVSSDLIRQAVAKQPLTTWAGGELANQLKMVSQMIRAGLKTRVYYVTLGSFDTHSGQGAGQGRHANLLKQLADSLKSFYGELKAQGNDGRVLTMAFSEFGRRVGQNASGGTDHGTAAPMFLAGPMVRAGVLSDHPSMKDLDEGDLKFKVDFRTVYAAILADWLRCDPKGVLQGEFKAAPVLKV